jgi:hypothetical protein
MKVDAQPGEFGWHGAQAFQASTPAQGQQYGLCLVIGMLGNCYVLNSKLC